MGAVGHILRLRHRSALDVLLIVLVVRCRTHSLVTTTPQGYGALQSLVSGFVVAMGGWCFQLELCDLDRNDNLRDQMVGSVIPLNSCGRLWCAA